MKAKKLVIEKVSNGFILTFNSFTSSILKEEYDSRKKEVYLTEKDLFKRIQLLTSWVEE